MFGGGSPPPMVIPPTPAPPTQMTQPTSAKPSKKPMAPSFIGDASAPSPQQTGVRTLIGGAPTQLGV